jgi:hypothetical protein
MTRATSEQLKGILIAVFVVSEWLCQLDLVPR